LLLLQVQVSEIILTMALLEIDSFVLKFKNLLHLEKDATLTMKSEAGRAVVTLSVELGHVLSAPLHCMRKPRNSPSRQRRREKRAAARQSEKDTGKEATEKVQDQPMNENVKTSDTAEQADSMIGDKNLIVPDEVCKDEDYEVAPLVSEETSVCSIELYPEKYGLDGLESFRAKIEEYFKKRTDEIKRVIKCEVENFGNNVKLVTEVKMKRGWIFFFCDPEENYADLYSDGIRTVRHSCKDLSICGG
jgi:hypothetical protein